MNFYYQIVKLMAYTDDFDKFYFSEFLKFAI